MTSREDESWDGKKKTVLSALVTVGALFAYKYAIWYTGPLCKSVGKQVR